MQKVCGAQRPSREVGIAGFLDDLRTKSYKKYLSRRYVTKGQVNCQEKCLNLNTGNTFKRKKKC